MTAEGPRAHTRGQSQYESRWRRHPRVWTRAWTTPDGRRAHENHEGCGGRQAISRCASRVPPLAVARAAPRATSNDPHVPRLRDMWDRDGWPETRLSRAGRTCRDRGRSRS